MKVFRCLSTIIVLALLVAACTPFSNGGASGSSSPTAQGTADASPLTCPFDIQVAVQGDSNCQIPHSMRVAYGVESLMQRGYTGKGQTIHAIAPGANIVVLTSPVDETEGTIGLPQFLELEQYALSHHLGSIISQSFGASEVTLKDSAGQQEIQQWDAFYKQATTQQGITFFGSSGDNGATDYTDLNQTQLSTTPTTSFPPDVWWPTLSRFCWRSRATCGKLMV